VRAAAVTSLGARATPINDEGYTPGQDGTYSQKYPPPYPEDVRCEVVARGNGWLGSVMSD